MKTTSLYEDAPLAFCLILSVFLMLPHIPLWAFASSMIFWFYRLVLDYSSWRTPSRLFTGVFSVIFLGICYFSFKTIIGREATCAFIVILLGLKALEYRDPKERGFIILLGLYLFTSKFLYETEFIWVSIGLPPMVVLIFYLFPETYRKNNLRASALFLFKSLAMALPLSVFLFFYFPRFSTELFQDKISDPHKGGVGFADQLQPGSVSALIENEDVAFRAEFFQIRPTLNSLYWRGLSLTQSNGMEWSYDFQNILDRPTYSSIDTDGPYIQITLEPHYKQILFTLEQTSSVKMDDFNTYTNSLGVFKSESLIDRRTLYRTISKQNLTRPTLDTDPIIELKQPVSPNLRRLLNSLRADTPEKLIQNISEFLVKQKFQYTLEPGDQGSLTLEDFLFKTKKGFCEHYASATALLLNYALVPARIIVGYHGGEYNPVGRFWTIKQRDAHAWIEYMDSDKLWHRFDPTAVVAPMRLALGAQIYAQIQNNQLDIQQLQALATANETPSYWLKVRFSLEYLSYQWNHIFVNFDMDRQKELLNQLDIQLGTAILLGMLTTLILSLSISWLFRNRQPLSRSRKIFNLINQTMANHNLNRLPSEGPIAWKQRLQKAFPENIKELDALIDCYILEAYSDNQSNNHLKRAQQILKIFK